MRRALESFLHHRSSTQLETQASATMTELLGALDNANLAHLEERLQIYNRFGECKFGFMAALRQWPENERARAGLSRSVEAMVEAELNHGDTQAATTLLADIKDVDPALIERVDKAREHEHRTQEELEAHARVGRSLAPGLGARSRMLAVFVTGGVFTLKPLLFPTHTQATYLLSSIIAVLLFSGLLLAVRQAVLESRFNRGIALGILLMLMLLVVIHGIGYARGHSVAFTATHQQIAFACTAGVLAATVDWRLVPVALSYLAGYVFVAIDPELRNVVAAANHGFGTLWVVLIWNRDLARHR